MYIKELERTKVMRKKIRDLELLISAIDKWISVYNGAAERGAFDCQLCHKYNITVLCSGCPVSAKTGHEFCKQTPYQEWRKTSAIRYTSSTLSCDRFAVDTEAKKAALKMAVFLVDLTNDTLDKIIEELKQNGKKD